MLRRILAVLVLVGAAAQAEPMPKLSAEATRIIVPLKHAVDAKDWPDAIRAGEQARRADLSDYELFLVDRMLLVAYFGSGDHRGAMQAAYHCVMSPAIPPEDLKVLLKAALSLAAEQGDNNRIFDIARSRATFVDASEDANTLVATAYFNTHNKAAAHQYAQRAAQIARAEGREPQTAVLQLLQFTEGF